MEKIEYYIWFSKLKISNLNKFKLIKIFKKIENIWNAKEEILKRLKLNSNIINELLNYNYRDLTKDSEIIKKENIEILFLKDKKYPLNLKKIKNPPIFLFVKGNIQNLYKNRIIGMVGSRECSNYGENAAKYFSRELAKENICIISGLATGIDKYAHLGSYKEKGKTIAVMGNGVDICYPKENEKLYEEILKNDGTIISEYYLGTKPSKEQFPERNRIISGLSQSLIVVEAKERSGTFSTVNYALFQGKDVYAIPRKYK